MLQPTCAMAILAMPEHGQDARGTKFPCAAKNRRIRHIGDEYSRLRVRCRRTSISLYSISILKQSFRKERIGRRTGEERLSLGMRAQAFISVAVLCEPL